MTELEKIEYAKSFIDKLANGINPLDDSPIPENDLASHARLSKCFSYVSDILRRVIESGGIQTAKGAKQHKNAFCLSDNARKQIQVSDIPLSVSELAKYLNSLIDPETTNPISATTINHWLLKLQLLEVKILPNGKKKKYPTQQGQELGIFMEERTGQFGTYTIILFSPAAQQFVYDNIDAAIALKEEKDDTEFQGQVWTAAQEEQLINLFQNHVPVSEIASTLKRTKTGIRARLKKLGLIENRSDAR